MERGIDVGNNPLISLCITNYNQADYIRATLESAFAQTYSPLEIIIGDDCSTDNSPDLIQDVVDDYQRRGDCHQIRYIRNEHNLGLVRNYENLFSIAKGELVVTGGGTTSICQIA